MQWFKVAEYIPVFEVILIKQPVSTAEGDIAPPNHHKLWKLHIEPETSRIQFFIIVQSSFGYS